MLIKVIKKEKIHGSTEEVGRFMPKREISGENAGN